MTDYLIMAVFVGMGLFLLIFFAKEKTKRLQFRSRQPSKEFEERLRRLEESLEVVERLAERMANIETLVVEEEKKREFNRVL